MFIDEDLQVCDEKELSLLRLQIGRRLVSPAHRDSRYDAPMVYVYNKKQMAFCKGWIDTYLEWDRRILAKIKSDRRYDYYINLQNELSWLAIMDYGINQKGIPSSNLRAYLYGAHEAVLCIKSMVHRIKVDKEAKKVVEK